MKLTQSKLEDPVEEPDRETAVQSEQGVVENQAVKPDLLAQVSNSLISN